MHIRGNRHKQAAESGDSLRSAEYGFSTEVLSENTAEHLREYITPVKRAENGRLDS